MSLAACVLPLPGLAAEVKISTWNLDWLTIRSKAEADLPADVHVRVPGDFQRLALYARKLDADVVAFQEVDGAGPAALLFDPAAYRIVTIDEPVVQQVGIAVRKAIGVHKNPDLTGLDVESEGKYHLRYGLDATLDLPGGTTMRVLVVHLKTGCQTESLEHTRRAQCLLLARQIPPLAAWVTARHAEGVPFLLLGDFNRVFDEPEAFAAALAQAAPLVRATAGMENPCWDGAPFIDHIFLGGGARDWLVPDSLRVQVFHEIGEGWKERLSDHCPVSIKLKLPDEK